MSDTARMHSFVRSQILAYLREHARGYENAIPRHVVMEHICYAGSDRHFRMLYKDIGVGSCDSGIFWPVDRRDVEFCRAYWTRVYLKDLADEKVKALLAARPELRPPAVGVQGELDYGGGA